MPEILFYIIPQSNCPYKTRNALKISHINVKHQFFKNSYFPSTIIEWNKLDSNIRNLEILNIFKSKTLNFKRTNCKQYFWLSQPYRNKATYQTTTWAKSPSRAQIQT